METIQEIIDREREIILASHRENIKKIDEQIDVLQTQRAHYEERIKQLTINTLFPSNGDNAYRATEWGVAKKAEYVLAKYGQIANTRKIAELINAEENSTHTESQLKSLVSALGATLKQKVDKKQTFNRTEAENKELYYGLKDWFYEEEELLGGVFVKPEYDLKYKKAYVLTIEPKKPAAKAAG